MNTIYKRYFLVLIPVLLLISSAFAQQAEKDIKTGLAYEIIRPDQGQYNILLLNSYHEGYRWTDSLTEQIKQELNNIGLEYEMYIHNLDSKRTGNVEIWAKRTRVILEHYPSDFFDLIIATDDNAVGTLMDNNVKDIPIVFCGVSDYQKNKFADFNNITGVVQSANIKETLDLAIRLFPETKNIAFISDNTKTGITYRNIATYNFVSHPELNIIWLDGREITSRELFDRVATLPSATVAMIGIWQKDSENVYYRMEKIYPEISKKCTAPIFTVSDLGMGYGIVGGKIPSVESQAKLAVELASRILMNPEVIPAIKERTLLDNKFDYQQLARWSIGIKQIPNNSIIINKPATLSKQVIFFFWVSSITTVVLVLLLTFLSIYITRYKKIKEQQMKKDRENSLIMNSLPLWCGITSDNGKILVSNDDYKQHEKSLFTLWIESCPNLLTAINTTSRDDSIHEIQFEYENKTMMGIIKPVDYQSDNHNSLVFIAFDITEKIRIQQQTEKANNLLNMAMQTGKSCYWVWDINSFSIETNINFWLCQGIKNRTDTLLNIAEFWLHVNKEDEEKVRYELNCIADDVTSSCSFECRLNFSGDDIWFNLQVKTAERDRNGRPEKVGIYMSNINSIKSIELELIEKNTQLLDAQEIARIGNWVLNLEENTISASPEFFKILGLEYCPLGTFDKELLSSRIVNFSQFDDNLNQLTTFGDIWEDYSNLYDNDEHNHIKTVWSSVRFGTNEQNQPVLMGVTQDITERVEMENELRNREQYLIQAANLAKMYYWSYDAESGLTIFYNSSSIWGENNIDGVHTVEKIISYIHPDDKSSVESMIEQVFNGNVSNGSFTNRMLVNGITKYVTTNWECYYNQDNSLESVLGIVIDISDQKDRELAEIQQKEAEAIAKAKGVFLATMSHEIRTPINVVIGMNHLLQETKLDDVQYNFVTKIDRAANSLLGIINDILDISKIEENKLTIENIEFSPRDIIYNNTSILAAGAEKNNVEMHIKIDQEIPARLIGDPLRISQILTNLLSNAVKFTQKGNITLSVKLLTMMNNIATIQFEIYDSGIGIKPDCLEKLFKPYSQAEESTSRKFGGTGLGLAICKQLSELMGGTIEAESVEGEGSTFTVKLPFEVPANIKDSPSYQIPELTGKNALIVDDNQTSLEVLSELIISAGFSVTLASSGREAVEIVSSSGKVFDLAIIDWMMPGMDGVKTLKNIIETKLSREPQFIAVTSHNRENIIQECLSNGFLSVISKPVNPEELLSAIRKAFGLSVSNPVRKNKESLPNLAGTHILVVEDQELNQEIIINLLEKTKSEIVVASNGIKAVEMATNQKFDLILMDIQMPEMNGLEATRIIRNHPDKNISQVPILAMTANAMQEDVENSLQAGMNDHITKPINPGLLYKKIKEYLCNTKGGNADTLEVLGKIQNLNTYSGIKYAGGDKELFLNTLSKFIENSPKHISELNDALKNKDTGFAVAAVHTIKGAAGTIGAEQLKNHANTIEYSLSDNPENMHMETEISAMIKEVESLTREIEEVLGKSQAKKTDNS